LSFFYKNKPWVLVSMGLVFENALGKKFNGEHVRGHA
jgi:hypothetical protein